MTATPKLTPAAEEVHRAISQKAVGVLGGMIDGNGLKAQQVLLVRQETEIHLIPAAISVTLKPDRRIRRAPDGAGGGYK